MKFKLLFTVNYSLPLLLTPVQCHCAHQCNSIFYWEYNLTCHAPMGKSSTCQIVQIQKNLSFTKALNNYLLWRGSQSQQCDFCIVGGFTSWLLGMVIARTPCAASTTCAFGLLCYITRLVSEVINNIFIIVAGGICNLLVLCAGYERHC